VEFGKHITKSLWGLADKALPVVYGFAYVVLVIRVLPEEEFSNFVLLQEVFLILSGLATALALQPMLKFASEDARDSSAIIIVGVLFNLALFLLASVVIVAVRNPLGSLLHAPTLAPLLLYIPAMLLASFIRNVALVLLQTRFGISKIFWVDALHFLGTPFMVWIYSRMHLFDSAEDLVFINIISLSASSLLGLILTWSMFRWNARPTANDLRRTWEYGRFSLGGNVSYLVYSKADTFILSAFTGPAQVAIYSSAKVFTRIFEMVTQIMQMFLLPGVSFLASRKEWANLKAVVEKSILFSGVVMLIVMIPLVLLSGPLVHIVYGGRYPDAVLILQIFMLMSLAVPPFAIVSNVLMGLGEARASFELGVQMLVVSLVAYLVLIPWFGAVGAAVGVVVASYVMAWVALGCVRRYVPFTVQEVLTRSRDIHVFVRSQFQRLTRRGE
jgi:O-antigen/teichoic acid export membrane protein